MRIAALLMALAALLPAAAPSAENDDVQRAQDLKRAADLLRPLHAPLGRPKPGDWLAVRHEPGQTFDQYVAGNPVRPVGERCVIYVQPIGSFDQTQRRIITQSADFMGRYFGRKVVVQPDLDLSIVPERARRVNPDSDVPQVLTTWVLEELLAPQMPKDAAARIALTTCDLWPGPGWNFVFGQASLHERVGVYSIYRNGDPHEGEAAYRLCLLRTIKTAVHEIGHMFGMHHCTAYACGMCGSNQRDEADRRPLALCPECMAKVCWAAQLDPVERYRKLAEFCRGAKLEREARFYERSIAALQPVQKQ
jgi:archaemetzincin